MAARNKSEGDGDPLAVNKYTAGGNRQSADIQPVRFSIPAWDRPARVENLTSNGDLFRTMSANGGLRGAAASFQPNVDNTTTGRLRLLSLNTTDDTPTIVTSAPALKHAVQEPIGTKSANSSPVHPKAWFTTDIDPNKPPMAGHFILVQGIKDSDLHNGVVSEIQKIYHQDFLGKKALKAAETGEYTDIVFFINDTRTATKIYNDLECEGMLTTAFVSHDWYNAGQGVRSGSVDAGTMYVGQVTFVAEFKGRTSEYDPTLNVYEAVRGVADDFGAVSAFEQNNSAQYPLWQFRCEFFKVTVAQRAMAVAGDGIKLESHPGWMIYVNQYVPLAYGNTAKKPAELNAVQAVAVPDGADVVMSPTGRTAWFTSSDGTTHPVPPPRPVANVDRVAIDHGPGPTWKGKEVAAYEPQVAATQYQRRGHENHYSIDSVLNGNGMGKGMGNSMGNGQGNELTVYGGNDKEKAGQDVIISRIFDGQDVRTTVMLRNIPNHWNWKKLKAVLDEVARHRYNFMYLRIDFKENKNVGYAFVNFENALDICDFVHTFVGKPWEPGHTHYGKPKLVQISYATIQGLDSLIDKFRNSSIMDKNVDFRPMLFQTAEEKLKEELQLIDIYGEGVETSQIARVGEKKAFPQPNNRAKKERSTANAGQIGLFSPRTNRNAAERWYRSQYDRGTPAQIMEDFRHAPFSGQAMMGPVPAFGYNVNRFQPGYGPMQQMPSMPALPAMTPMQIGPQPMHFMTAPHVVAPPRGEYMNGRPYAGPQLPARRVASGLPWNGSNVAGPSNYMNGQHNGNGM